MEEAFMVVSVAFTRLFTFKSLTFFKYMLKTKRKKKKTTVGNLFFVFMVYIQRENVRTLILKVKY